MATKLSIKNAAANPAKWDEAFLAKITAAGDHLYFTQQIFQKWWKKGLDDVFVAGAQLDLTLDENGFVWTIKTLTDPAAKKLAANAELVKVQTHKGKCSGFAPKVEPPKAEASKPEPTRSATPPVQETPKPTPKAATKPALTAEDIKARVKATLPIGGGKDDAEKYAARMKRVLEAEFSGVSDDHLKAVELLAGKLYFEKAKEAAPKASGPAKAKPTLTPTQAAAIDAAMRAAQAAANGPAEMLDNDAQVAMGDAIAGAVGGKYPTHSRGGGHKGSFNKDKSIQQQLSNIAAILSADMRAAINDHLGAHWKGYYM